MDAHVKAIAALFHAEAKAEGLPMATLGDIEQTVRQQLQTHVSLGIGNFLSKQIAQTPATHPDA